MTKTIKKVYRTEIVLTTASPIGIGVPVAGGAGAGSVPLPLPLPLAPLSPPPASSATIKQRSK